MQMTEAAAMIPFCLTAATPVSAQAGKNGVRSFAVP